MLSYGPLSSFPYSSLAETIVDGGADIESFILFDQSAIIKMIGSEFSADINSALFSNSYQRLYPSTIYSIDSSFISLAKSIFTSEINFELNSTVDYNYLIKLFSLSILSSDIDINISPQVKISTDVLLESIAELQSSYQTKIPSSSIYDVISNLLNSPKNKIDTSFLLNIDSGFESRSFIKFYNDSQIISNVEIESFGKNIYPLYGNLNLDSSLLENNRLLISGNGNLDSDIRFILNYFNKIDATSNILSNIETLSSASLKSFVATTMDIDCELDLVAKMRLFPQSESFNSIGNINLSPKIVINSDFTSDIDVILTSSYLSRTIGNIEINSNTAFDPSSYLKTYNDSSLLVDSNLSPLIGAKYKLSSDIDILGVIFSNLSLRNRDIVYYILAINKEEPFELKILRSK